MVFLPHPLWEGFFKLTYFRVGLEKPNNKDTDMNKHAPTIAMTAVKSSQIHSIGHCDKTNTLAIQFKTKDGSAGPAYHYPDFTSEHFAKFKGAESLGKHFGAHIKKLPFVKMPVNK